MKPRCSRISTQQVPSKYSAKLEAEIRKMLINSTNLANYAADGNLAMVQVSDRKRETVGNNTTSTRNLCTLLFSIGVKSLPFVLM